MKYNHGDYDEYGRSIDLLVQQERAKRELKDVLPAGPSVTKDPDPAAAEKARSRVPFRRLGRR